MCLAPSSRGQCTSCGMAVPGVRFWGLELMSTLSAAGPDCHHARLPEPGGDGGRGLSQGRRRSHAAAGAACLNPPPVNRGSDRPRQGMCIGFCLRTGGSSATWTDALQARGCCRRCPSCRSAGAGPACCASRPPISRRCLSVLSRHIWPGARNFRVPRDGTHCEVASRNFRGAVCQVSACYGSGAKAKPI